jgi:tetratricopeptide (TPR) repeat protein
MTADQRLEADTNLLKAEELLKEGKYAEAAARLRKVTASKPSAKYAAQADAGTKKIEDAGRERLAKADEQAKTDADAAMAELMKIQDEFGGTRVATAAMQRLTALKNAANEPPKVGAPSTPKPEPPTKESEAAKADSQCRRWIELARNLIANKKADQARQYLWRIIDKYPDSEHAKTARKMIDEL